MEIFKLDLVDKQDWYRYQALLFDGFTFPQEKILCFIKHFPKKKMVSLQTIERAVF